MTVTSNHTQACFDAWMNCENLLVSLSNVKVSVSKKVTQVIDECALICMGTFKAIKTGSPQMSRLALLCVGICEECAEVCEEHDAPNFQKLASICRHCSDSLSYIAFPAAMIQHAVPTSH
jgi:ferredoxin